MIGENLCDLGIDKNILDMRWKTQAIKKQICKLYFIKTLKFLPLERHCKENENQATDCEKILHNAFSKGLVSRIYKELSKLSYKRTIHLQWAKVLNIFLPKSCMNGK